MLGGVDLRKIFMSSYIATQPEPEGPIGNWYPSDVILGTSYTVGNMTVGVCREPFGFNRGGGYAMLAQTTQARFMSACVSKQNGQFLFTMGNESVPQTQKYKYYMWGSDNELIGKYSTDSGVVGDLPILGCTLNCYCDIDSGVFYTFTEDGYGFSGTEIAYPAALPDVPADGTDWTYTATGLSASHFCYNQITKDIAVLNTSGIVYVGKTFSTLDPVDLPVTFLFLGVKQYQGEFYAIDSTGSVWFGPTIESLEQSTTTVDLPLSSVTDDIQVIPYTGEYYILPATNAGGLNFRLGSDLNNMETITTPIFPQKDNFLVDYVPQEQLYVGFPSGTSRQLYRFIGDRDSIVRSDTGTNQQMLGIWYPTGQGLYGTVSTAIGVGQSLYIGPYTSTNINQCTNIANTAPAVGGTTRPPWRKLLVK